MKQMARKVDDDSEEKESLLEDENLPPREPVDK